jgi:TFIIF-interacting CTD phosphatase-like protein
MERLNIILDLDSTIIYGEECKKANLDEIKKNYKNVHTMDTSYYIIERPGLQDFLTFLFKNFNVSIWTAASKNYALFIIKEVILKDNRKIDWFFHSKHCDISEKISKSKEQKDLNILWETFKITNYNKDNTLIIDDNELVFNTQKTNCIKVLPPFELKNKSSTNDTFLTKLQQQLTDEFLSNKQNTLEQSVNNINKLNELNK